MKKLLPLSWEIASAEKINLIPLFWRSTKWLSICALKKNMSFDNLIKSLPNNNSYFIRGLNSTHSKELQKMNFEVMPSGVEAILNLSQNHFNKKSLKELIRRGMRFGTVKEYSYSEELKDKIEKFKRACSHGNEPELTHLFVTQINCNHRIFIFEGEKMWKAAIVVSENSNTKYQAELLLRRKNAPIGVMEALIYSVFVKLKKSGKQYFSLGEVPLILDKNHKKTFKQKLILLLGAGVGLVYNYKGLYKFKNKFNPIWQDVYIAQCPKISMLDLTSLTFKTNLVKLALHKLFFWF